MPYLHPSTYVLVPDSIVDGTATPEDWIDWFAGMLENMSLGSGEISVGISKEMAHEFAAKWREFKTGRICVPAKAP